MVDGVPRRVAGQGAPPRPVLRDALCVVSPRPTGDRRHRVDFVVAEFARIRVFPAELSEFWRIRLRSYQQSGLFRKVMGCVQLCSVFRGPA